MIVADTNLIAYLLISGEFTKLVEDVLKIDDDWSVPILWRSEFRNVLSLYMRTGSMNLNEANQTMKIAEDFLRESEYAVSSEKILDIVSYTNLSAYDAEYVSLAKELGVNLVTNDRKILNALGNLVLSIEGFLKDGKKS